MVILFNGINLIGHIFLRTVFQELIGLTINILCLNMYMMCILSIGKA